MMKMRAAPLLLLLSMAAAQSSGSSGGGGPAACPAANSITQHAVAALRGQPAYGASYGPTPSYNPSASYGASPTYMPSSTFMPAPSYGPPPPGASYAPTPILAPATRGFTVSSQYSDSACTISSGSTVVFSALTGGSTCDSVSTTACTRVSGTSSPDAYQKVSACTPNDAIPAPTSGGVWQSAWRSSSSCSGPIFMAANIAPAACSAHGSGSSMKAAGPPRRAP